MMRKYFPALSPATDLDMSLFLSRRVKSLTSSPDVVWNRDSRDHN